MKLLTPLFVSLIISGLESFWPLGSPIIALSAVLGTKYPNSRGIITVVLIGLVRDVLLVNRLGISSAIVALAWLLASLGTVRLGRPLAISVVAAAVAAAPAGFFPGPVSYQFILATAALAGIFSAVWNFIWERDEKIRVR